MTCRFRNYCDVSSYTSMQFSSTDCSFCPWVCRKKYTVFRTVWHDCGFAWEDMEEWMVQKHVPSMQILHIEGTIFIIVFISSIIVITILLDHIRRWLSGLVIMMEGWDIQLIHQVRFFSFMYNICHLIFDFRFVKSSSHMVRDWTETGSKAGISSADPRSSSSPLT